MWKISFFEVSLFKKWYLNINQDIFFILSKYLFIFFYVKYINQNIAIYDLTFL